MRAREKLTSESFNDTARVVLEVTEVLANENNPKFNKTSYIVNVTEGVSPGKVIQVCTIHFLFLKRCIKTKKLYWIALSVLNCSP